MAFVSCPNCDRSIDLQARYCEHCGADLAVAAVLAESRVQTSVPILEGVMLTPEILVPRLGDYLLEKGIVTAGELNRALEYQRQKLADDQPVLLGRVLIELGLVDSETLDKVITEQIIQLQSALRQSNTQLEQRVHERTEDLQRALEKLAELNQLKANFIANISHELRTPLTHIKGYLDIFADEGLGPLNKEQHDGIEIMRKAEARLERLIEDLIQFSLASRGELSLHTELEDINDLVERAVENTSHKAHAKNINLSVNLSPQKAEVKCDGEKIIWVISQLLDNAFKYTGTSGTVEVRTNQLDNLASIVVADTGIGIPSEQLEDIFLPFHQLDGSTTRRYGGTGVGLALCNRIIEAHGSSIQVRSVVGEGSTFTFALPTAPRG